MVAQLNFVPNIMHHFEAYGGWSFVLSDYYAENITAMFSTDAFRDMIAIEDPYMYRDRLIMPKVCRCFAVCARLLRRRLTMTFLATSPMAAPLFARPVRDKCRGRRIFPT